MHNTDVIPVVELQVTQELRAPSLGGFETTVLETLTVGPRTLVVDLSGYPAIDAAGVAMLLDLHRQMRRAGRKLTVRDPSPQVRRILQIARVDQILDIVPAGPAEALAQPGPMSDR